MHEFTLERARALINQMRIRFGKKFTDQWAAVGEFELEQAMVEDLSGLTDQQLRNGYNRMRQEAWPPSIPEFKIWCLQGSNWLTENEAWHQALAYEKSNQTIAISVHVQKTLKEFKAGFDEINPKSETQAKAFKDMYVRLISDAKRLGETQSFTDPVLMIEKPVDENRDCVPCPPDLMVQLKGINKNAKAGRA